MEASYFLRHFLAGLKYRCSKAITNVPDNYPTFEVGCGVRKPIEILYHINHVLRCAQSVFDEEIELAVNQKSWKEEVEQFDIEFMTHVGQLSMIRRLAGDPIPGVSFFDADIRVGLTK